MNNRSKKFYAWLLTVIMAISAVGSAMAADFDHNKPAGDCRIIQLPLTDSDSIAAEENCSIELGEDSKIITECHSPCNIYSPTLQTTQFGTRYVFQQKILFFDNPILSYYPDLLKRPPKT